MSVINLINHILNYICHDITQMSLYDIEAGESFYTKNKSQLINMHLNSLYVRVYSLENFTSNS